MHLQFHKDFYLRHPDASLQCEEYCWGNLEAAHPVIGSRTVHEVEQYRREQGIIVHTLRGRSAPKPFQSFEETSFPVFLAELAYELFTDAAVPKPPQAQAWPCVLAGMDLIIVSPTGSGKTLAYLLPALVHIIAQPELGPGEGPIALVLVPTRELAQQTLSVAQRFCERTCGNDTIRAGAVFGGVDASIHEPSEGAPDFGRWPELLIATPGRLQDLLQRNRMKLLRATYIVVDEADLLIRPGMWGESVRNLLQAAYPERQLIFVAATWPEQAHQTAVELSGSELVWLKVEPAIPAIPQDVRLFHEYENVTPRQVSPLRRVALLNYLQREYQGGESVLLFCANDGVAEELMLDPDITHTVGRSRIGALVDSKSLCSDRWETYRRFVTGELRMLITTFALGARGLDYMDTAAASTNLLSLSLTVLLFDFPRNIIEYTHCIGRTLRPGHKVGRVIAFLPEVRFWIAEELQEVLERSGQAVPSELSSLVAKDRTFVVQCQAAMLRLKDGLTPWPEATRRTVLLDGEEDLKEDLKDFRGQFDESKCMWTLASSLPSYRRRLLHALADESNLPHVSTGRPPARCLHVARCRESLPDRFFLEGESVLWQPRQTGGRTSRPQEVSAVAAARVVDPKVHPVRRTVRVRLQDGREMQAAVDELTLAEASSMKSP